MTSADSDPHPHTSWIVNTADALAIASVLVAVVAVLGGGFRLWLGEVRISVTSPVNPLLLALVTVVARHLHQRRPSLVARVREFVVRLERSDECRTAWAPFAMTRVTILLVGLLAVYTVGLPDDAPPFKISDNEAVNLAARWDAGWYLSIATSGYQWHKDNPTAQQNVAFFPAYPLIMKVTGRLLGGSVQAFVVAGLIVSHAAFFLALVYFVRLLRIEVPDESAASRGVLLLTTYPYSVFHGAIYTESLFLLCCLGAVLGLKEQRLRSAAAWGLLAGLTRPNGFLLAVPLAVGLLPAMWTARRVSWPRLAVACAPVAGVALVSAYVWWITGNPLQWSAQHVAWGRTFTGLAPVTDTFDFIRSYGFERYAKVAPYELMNGAAALVALALIVPVWRRFGLFYALLIAVNLLPPLFRGGVLSIGRLTATLFPLFLWAAWRLDWKWTVGLATVFMAFQAIFAVLFYTWRPMF